VRPVNWKRVRRNLAWGILTLAIVELLARASTGSLAWRVGTLGALLPGECRSAADLLLEELEPGQVLQRRGLLWRFGLWRIDSNDDGTCVFLLKDLRPLEWGAAVLDGGTRRVVIRKKDPVILSTHFARVPRWL
jgi:hypothetical protein